MMTVTGRTEAEYRLYDDTALEQPIELLTLIEYEFTKSSQKLLAI